MPVLSEQQKGLIGVEGEPRPAAYPVNEIMAQFWCEMVEDANPIYFDEAFARSTWLKGRFAPPPMILIWRMPPVWPARDQENAVARLGLDRAGCTATIAVNAVQEYEQPLRYGDRLTATVQIASVGDEKATRLGTGHFVTTLDTFRNQHGQVAGTHSFTLFVYAPRGADGAGEQGARSKEQGPGSKEEGARSKESGARSEDGGGGELGRLRPVSIDLTLRRAIQAVAGTRDYYPFHHDEKFARENGAEGIFFNTMFLQAFVGRCATEWFGNDAFLRRMEIAMRGSNYVGRTLTARAVMTDQRAQQGYALVDVDCTLSTEDGPTTVVKFSVQLPPR